MKKKTKIILGTSGLVLAGLAYAGYEFITPDETPIDSKATVSSNYYQAINKDWLTQAEIPADQPSVNDFYLLSEDIKTKFSKDLENLASGKESSDLLGMSEFQEFYQLATDYEAREKAGIEPIKPFLKDIENLKSLDDLSQHIVERTKDGLAQPFAITIGQDLKNTSKKVITLTTPGLFLLDTSYYEDEASYKQLEEMFKTSTTELLTKMGYDKKKADQLVKDAMAFDSQLAKHLPSMEEQSDVEATYNIRTAEEVKAYSKTFDFVQAANDLVGQEITEFNVTWPEFYGAFDKLVSEDNFNQIKAWLLVNEAMSSAPYLTDELRVAAGGFGRAINGIAEPESKEDATYSLVTDLFSPTLSTYYGQKYFGQSAKEDVTEMIDNIVDVYKKRLADNDWLSQKTKEKAVEKLDHLTYYVGYPEEIPAEIKEIDVDPSKNMVENMIELSRQSISYNFEHFNDPIDKEQWFAPSYMVNAFYDPTNNAITFPAAILADPFYSEKNSDAQNYGAIGVVIGHEISHGFDNNGSKFDKDGNLSDWWTKEDYKIFEEKTQAFIDQWDGIEIYDNKVNGTLTVGENIADAGGLSASLEALQSKDKSAKLDDFFKQYATIWRMKASLQYNQLLLTMDTHAPAELRVNQQLKNFTPFYDTYDIKEEDAMYLPEEERISLW